MTNEILEAIRAVEADKIRYGKASPHVCDQCGNEWLNWPLLCDHCHPGFYAEVSIRSSKVVRNPVPETRLMGC